MTRWLSIPAADRASVVEMTYHPLPVPYPTLTISPRQLKAWARAQGIRWRWQDKGAITDAWIVAQYEEVGGGA